MRQLHYMGEVGSLWGGEVLRRGGEARGGGCLHINPLAGDLSTSERDYETTTLHGRGR